MSLFKRPAWAKTQVSSHDDADDNIFSHSSRSYQEIVAEEQRKKRAKAEKQKVKEERKERKSSRRHDVKEEDPNGSSSKRRRITLEESSNLLKEVGLPSEIQFDDDNDTDDQGDIDDVPQIMGDDAGEGISIRRSPRFAKVTGRNDPRYQIQEQPDGPAIIEIGGSDEEEEDVLPVPQQHTADEIDDYSDDELADLRRQARAKRLLEVTGKKSQTPDVAAKPPTPQNHIGSRIGLPTPPLSDPTIQIFISSPIEGAKPLIVHRKLSQNLKAIREVWCAKQAFPAGITSDTVFLTYRMRKVYDATTCRSLGLEANAQGSGVMDGADEEENINKVHLEAVTEALLVQLKSQKAWEERKRQGLLSGDEDPQADVSATETQNASKDETLIKLVLKAKGKDDFKLRVKPSTLIARIVKACRGTFQVPDDQSMFLDFDGERLDESAEVQSTELSDMDCIDVHIG